MNNNEERLTGGRLSALSDGVKSFFQVQLVPLVVLLLIIVAASSASPVFLTGRNIQNLVVQVATTMVISMSMLMVILTGGIDLSVGSIVAISGVLVVGLMDIMPVGLSILLATALGIFIGAVNGIIVSKFKIAPFIVTLGMQSFARGCAYWYTESQPIIWSSKPGADFMYQLGSGKIGNIPILTVIWIFMVIATLIILRYTVLGRIVYGIGGNEEAVRLSGINISRWKLAPYIFSGFCCGITGVLLTARLGVGSPTSGSGMELDAIAAVIVGGTSFNGGIGTVSGVIIGVFILGIINNILDLMNVMAYPQMMLKGVITVAAVILATIRDKSRQ